MKKVLVITYYWPPSGGGGVQRWLKFSKYLGRFGWDPVIVTPENPAFPFTDPSLEQDVPREIEVLKLPIWEPYHLVKKKSQGGMEGQALDKPKQSFLDLWIIWIRGNFMIPDPRVFWVRPATRFLKDLILERDYKIIITTGPPHSLHLIGRKLKKQTGVTWIADFRDPWSDWHQLRHLKVSKLVRRVHKKMEERVLKNADLVLTVSDPLKNDFVRLGANQVKVITNGYDPTDFPTQPKVSALNKFRISHIGTIDDLRDPAPFLNGLKAAIKIKPEIREVLEVRFFGILGAAFLQPFLDDPELKPFIETGGYISHDQIPKIFSESAVLLLILSDFKNADAYLPGKFFEYAGSGRPVFAIAPPDGSLGKAIMNNQNNKVIHPESSEAIVGAILDYYEKYKTGDLNESNPDLRYSRVSLTKDLADILDGLISEDAGF